MSGVNFLTQSCFSVFGADATVTAARRKKSIRNPQHVSFVTKLVSR